MGRAHGMKQDDRIPRMVTEEQFVEWKNKKRLQTVQIYEGRGRPRDNCKQNHCIMMWYISKDVKICWVLLGGGRWRRGRYSKKPSYHIKKKATQCDGNKVIYLYIHI